MTRSSLAVIATALALAGCGESHTRPQSRALPDCAYLFARDWRSGRCQVGLPGGITLAAVGKPAQFGDVRLLIRSVHIQPRIPAGGGFGPLHYRRGKFVVIRARVTDVGKLPLDFSGTMYWRLSLLAGHHIFRSFDQAALRLRGTGNSLAFPIQPSRTRDVWMVFWVANGSLLFVDGGLVFFIG